MTLRSQQLLLLSLVFSALVACTEKKTEQFDEDTHTRKQQKEDRLDYLRARFPGISEFKSTDDPLSVTLQEKMRGNEMFLITGFKLLDVSRGDSTWSVKLKSAHRTNHILHLTCDSSLAQRVIDVSTAGSPNPDRRHQLGSPSAIVARVISINRTELYIASKGEKEGEDVYSQIELDTDLPLSIAGELIEVQ